MEGDCGKRSASMCELLQLSVSPLTPSGYSLAAHIDFFITSFQNRHTELGPIAQSINLSIHHPTPHLHDPGSSTNTATYSM